MFILFSSLFIGCLTQPAFAQFREWQDLDGDGVLCGDPPLTQCGPVQKSCLINGVPTLKCFEVVLGNLLFMSNAFVILILFVMLFVGGFQYILSLGNPEKIQKAHATLKWAFIGIILYVSSYLILNIIDILFLGGNGDLFRFQLGP